MTTIFGIVGGWVLLNAALFAALLLRRNRPEARAKLLEWVLKGERRPQQATQTKAASESVESLFGTSWRAAREKCTRPHGSADQHRPI